MWVTVPVVCAFVIFLHAPLFRWNAPSSSFQAGALFSKGCYNKWSLTEGLQKQKAFCSPEGCASQGSSEPCSARTPRALPRLFTTTGGGLPMPVPGLVAVSGRSLCHCPLSLSVCLWAHVPAFYKYPSYTALRASLQDGLILTTAAMTPSQPFLIRPLRAIAPHKHSIFSVWFVFNTVTALRHELCR